jgi:hypothetical protein
LVVAVSAAAVDFLAVAVGRAGVEVLVAVVRLEDGK